MKYIISTIGKDLVTVTDKELAEKFFEQNKEKYNYLKLSKEITNPYPHNGKYTVRESIEISYRQKEVKTMAKAIVTVETKKTYYLMEYIEIKEITVTAETEDKVLSEILPKYYRGNNVIKVKFLEK